MGWNLITTWALTYTFVLMNVESFSLPQTTVESSVEIPNVYVKTNQSFGNIYDVDVVMQSFLSFPDKIAYFTANHRIINKALYPEHRQFHSFVQTLIYNNYHCSVSWSELNAFFMVFPSETRKKLGWELKTAFQTTNITKIFDPCLFEGVSCMLHQNTTADDADNQYHDITYVGSHYISAIAINSNGLFFPENIFKTERKKLSIFLNYSLPQYLSALILVHAKIYGFSFAKMPKDLHSFRVAGCIFYSISDLAFLWNSIPTTVGTIEIVHSVIDVDSTDYATWTFITSFKDIDESLNSSIKLDDLEFIPTWYKPKLKQFVIHDFGNFRNDPSTLNVNKFLLHVPMIAPNLQKIRLNMLDLNGFVHTEQLSKILNPKSRHPKVQISLFKSGLDMIGYGPISCGIHVAPDDFGKTYFMREMHVFENFERFFECQQRMLEMIDGLSKEHRVEHQFLFYDDVMEVYNFYQTGFKSNVSVFDADRKFVSFDKNVNISHQHQQGNDSLHRVISHRRFVRHCGVPPVPSENTEESHSFRGGSIVFSVCVLILIIVAVVALVSISSQH